MSSAVNAFSCLGLFLVGVFVGLRVAAITHRTTEVTSNPFTVPDYIDPIPHPQVDQEYRS
jgi:hypothetical protein